MSHSMHQIVNGEPRKVKKLYIIMNGVPREVKKGYQILNGVPRIFYENESSIVITFDYSYPWYGATNNLYDNRTDTNVKSPQDTITQEKGTSLVVPSLNTFSQPLSSGETLIYTFTGWRTQPNDFMGNTSQSTIDSQGLFSAGTNGSAVPATINPTENTTYYAQWKLDQKLGFLISHDASNHTYAYYTGTDNKILLPTPTKTYYQFLGWYTTETGGTKLGDGNTRVALSQNGTYHGQWRDNRSYYTVTFDNSYAWYNGDDNLYGSSGYTYDSCTPITVEVGQSITLPTPADNPAQTSSVTGLDATWTFQGWRTAESNFMPDLVSINDVYEPTYGGTRIGKGGATYTPSANITLYGSWTLDQRLVTAYSYNAWSTNSPTINSPAEPAIGDVYYWYTDHTGRVNMEQMTFSPHTFRGWYTSPNGQGELLGVGLYPFTTRKTIYAYWQYQYYTIKYSDGQGSHSNDSTVVVGSRNLTRLATAAATSYSSTHRYGDVHYDFQGWYSASGGGGTKLGGSNSIFRPDSYTSYFTDYELTLYAYYMQRKFTITLNYNYSSRTALTAETDSDSELKLQPATSNTYLNRSNFSFVGWYTAKTGGTLITSTASPSTWYYYDGNVTLKSSASTSYTLATAGTVWARWEMSVQYYTVTYSANNPARSSDNVQAGNYTTLPSWDSYYDESNTVIKYYTPDYWALNGSSVGAPGSQYYPSTSVTLTGVNQVSDEFLYNPKNISYTKSSTNISFNIYNPSGKTIYYRVYKSTGNGTWYQSSQYTTTSTGTISGKVFSNGSNTDFVCIKISDGTLTSWSKVVKASGSTSTASPAGPSSYSYSYNSSHEQS